MELTMERHLQFTYLIVGGMLLGIDVLIWLHQLTLDHFIVLSFLILVVTTEYTAPRIVTNRWRKRLRWIVALGLAVFVYVSAQRILAILSPNTL
jgi:uncharacterized membrane protein YeiH